MVHQRAMVVPEREHTELLKKATVRRYGLHPEDTVSAHPPSPGHFPTYTQSAFPRAPFALRAMYESISCRTAVSYIWSCDTQDESGIDTPESAPEAACTAAAEVTPETSAWFPESPGTAADDTPQHIARLCSSPAFQRHVEERRLRQDSQLHQCIDAEGVATRVRVHKASYQPIALSCVKIR